MAPALLSGVAASETNWRINKKSALRFRSVAAPPDGAGRRRRMESADGDELVLRIHRRQAARRSESRNACPLGYQHEVGGDEQRIRALNGDGRKGPVEILGPDDRHGISRIPRGFAALSSPLKASDE